MKQSLTKRLLAILLVAVLTVSLLPLVSAFAQTAGSGDKIYADLGAVSWWLDANAAQKAYFFGSGGSAWADFTLVEGTDYSCTVPAGNWDHIILVRCDPNGTGDSPWDYKWNQTGDIALEQGKNYIKSFAENSAEATWDVYGGETPTDPTDPTDPPVPGDTDYYLVGYFDEADYYGSDYKFVDGKLTLSFNKDSYAFIKTGDGINYMTNGWQGFVNSATLYNEAEISETERNKLYVPGGKEITFTLAVNAEEDTLTLSYTVGGSSYTPSDHSGADDKVILHCWNWSFDEIKEYLPQIAAAGYTAVQTSPAQPHSGYREGEIGTGDWWMLYQPLGLHIAEADQSWLGDVNDLRELCDAAHELGIEVVVDVVSNHICNAYNDIAAQGIDPKSQVIGTQDGKTGYVFETIPDSRVAEFNPELFPEEGNPTKFFRDYVFCNDTNTEAVVHGNIGMPDFKTEESVVQQSVLAYLEELIDAGVDGFRFDAAKHIETPNDGEFASYFWPTVIGGAEAYAEEKGKTVWSYGEVLSTAGHTRKMNDYAPYIDMTEISYAYTITEAFGDHKGANTVANQLFKDWLGVGVETLKNTSLVLMAESHDMYAQGKDSFSRYDADVINKAWAVATARADTSSLYFARPQDYVYGLNADDPSEGFPIGTLGKCEDFNWMNPEVAAVNKFHTAFVGTNEEVYASGDMVVIERFGTSSEEEEICGAVLVNAGGANAAINTRVNHLTDGTYFDQITGNEFTVSSGSLSGAMGATGIVVLTAEEPTVCEHPADQRSEKVTPATCTEPEWTCTYCDVCHQLLSKVETAPALGHIDEDGDNHCDRCGEYLGVITVYFVDTNDWIPAGDYFNSVRCYTWGDAGEASGWPGEDMEIVGRTKDDHGIWMTALNPEKYNMVIFNAGENGAFQTENLSYVEDAGDSRIIVYTADYFAEGRPFNGTEKLYVNTAALYWWNSAGAILHMTMKKADGLPVDLILQQEDGAVFSAVIPAGNYKSLILSRFNPDYDPEQEVSDENKEIWNSTGEIVIPPQGNYVESFQDGTNAAVWANWPDAPFDKVNATPGAVLQEICGHTGYRVIDNGDLELVICDCCGETVEAEYSGSFRFDDVKDPNAYYYIPVYWAFTHDPQITDGVSDTLFGTNQNCTRAQVVTFLWRAYGCQEPKSTSNPFTDVKKEDYFYKPVLWAVENGITDGMTDTTFEPKGTCTRAQVVTFLWRAAGKPVPLSSSNKFTDVKSGDWFYTPVLWAVGKGVTDGVSDTTFEPDTKCIRAQVVTFLYRALKDQ